MRTYRLGPTQLYTPARRLLLGRRVEAAVGACRQAGDWLRLDGDVHRGTSTVTDRGRTRHNRIRVGFPRVDERETADWSRAPYWQAPGPDTGNGARPEGPSWSVPPTESEIVLCLAHADPRMRAAALALVEARALPEPVARLVVPLVLIRSADADERVRDLARAALAPRLREASEAELRELALLAVLMGARARGHWARDAILGPLGGPPAEALVQAANGGHGSRLAGLRAAAAHGQLTTAELWALAAQHPDESVRRWAVRTAADLALTSGQRTAVDDARSWLLRHLDTERAYGVRLETFAWAVRAGLLRAPDLADTAVGHAYRKLRRHGCDALLAHPDAHAHLDRLLAARDTYVRAAAVGRLRDAGRGDEVSRYLTDLSAAVRATACRDLRAAGGDPRAHYRALCADPAAVVPPAVIGLAEQGHQEDADLLHPLTRHPDPAVRARALSALRMLRALPDTALLPFADDPDPAVRATALTGMRESAALLRGQLHSRHERVRARVLDLLEWHRLNRADSCRCCGAPASTPVRRVAGPGVWRPGPAGSMPSMTARPDVTPFGAPFPSLRPPRQGTSGTSGTRP
ncbi:hypothetical protein [Streptomyces fragilis]|uniref:HEAT repeat domain-containing protein n=1 Tax=Streptomyces fragilis TaxID=67301 RepID=A0ABV2YDZ2_9ACTN|nr:hypothetical protein [Streptomyces fragilis]